MNEFLNVQEVDKLPLNKMDRFVGVDQDGNIKTSTIKIDDTLDKESNNAISNKAVTVTLETYKEDLSSAVNEVLDNAAEPIYAEFDRIRQEITTELQSTVDTITQANDKLRLDVAEDLEEMQNTVDSAVEYLEETVGNIDSVLLEILG
jgi:2',3'-cyclic-nucleotide 2'-phosphodiesterase (5'-nucleotidase family)